MNNTTTATDPTVRRPTADEADKVYGVRRAKGTGEWTLLDAHGTEVGPRLGEALTSREALAVVAEALATA